VAAGFTVFALVAAEKHVILVVAHGLLVSSPGAKNARYSVGPVWYCKSSRSDQSPANAGGGSELAVFARVALGAPDWILARIDPHLAARRLDSIDVENVGEPRKVKQDIGDFVRHFASRARIEPGALRRRQPLEFFEQLGGLDRQRHREILRRMELLPVARGGKPTQRIAQIVKGGGCVAHE